MYRRSLAVMAKQAGRTIVRDPRKKKVIAMARQETPIQQQVAPQQQPVQPPPLPFEPSAQNQQSVGSTLGSYALAGVGVTLGVVLVRVVLGF